MSFEGFFRVGFFPLLSSFQFRIYWTIPNLQCMQLWSPFERSVTFFEWGDVVVVHQSLQRDGLATKSCNHPDPEIKLAIVRIPRSRSRNREMQSRIRANCSFYTEKRFWWNFFTENYLVCCQGCHCIGVMLGNYSACTKHEEGTRKIRLL